MAGSSSAPRGRVLIVAGSDSGGGAGVQADIKTVTALGGHASSAITALTVQNTRGVFDVAASPPPLVVAQMRVVLEDLGADAIKTGMMGDTRLVEAVAEAFSDFAAAIPRIVDPVMVATSGDRLLPESAVDAVRRLLVPGAALVTPNDPDRARGRHAGRTETGGRSTSRGRGDGGARQGRPCRWSSDL